MTIRVVVAEDHQMVRQGVVMLLNAEPDIEVVGEAADGRQAVELVLATDPDVVLMDLGMPEMDGIEATRQLAPPGFQVLILTVMNDDQKVREALSAGAKGFVLKHAAGHDLATAIRRVSEGKGWLDPDVTSTVIAAAVAGLGTETSGETQSFGIVLTKREREVLVLMAEGLSNLEIAGRLYLAMGTVKTHVRNVISKSGARDRSQVVAQAYRTGFMTRAARMAPDPGSATSGSGSPGGRADFSSSAAPSGARAGRR